MNKIVLLSLLFLFINSQAITRGIIISPVVDCLGESIVDIQKKNTSIHYDNIAICTNGPSQVCPRIHQILYNTCVSIMHETDTEAKIQISDIFFQRKGCRTRHNVFWIAKKNIVPLETLKAKGILEKHLPCESLKDFTVWKKKIVTLIMPFYHKKIGITFCAGTRFVVQSYDKDQVHVHAFHPKTFSPLILTFPKNITLTAQPELSHDQKVKCMIKIMQLWTHYKKGIVPYVWGGCCIGQFCSSLFDEEENNENGITYIRKDMKYPYTGADCAGIITLAAQICGLPYYFKNSITIAQNLIPLQKNERIEAGDIIWLPGHVMIVSDVQKNLVIEERHYGHGYGKLQEITLPEMFQNISSYSDLKQAFFNQDPLIRLDLTKKPVQTINQFKIFKLKSLWKKGILW